MMIQRSFSHLKVLLSASTKFASNCFHTVAVQKYANTILRPCNVASCMDIHLATTFVRCLSTKPIVSLREEKSKAKPKEAVKSYDPASPYRNPGPRRYGYETRYFTGGLYIVNFLICVCDCIQLPVA